VREPVGELFVLAKGTTTRAERNFVVAAPAGAVRSERLAPPRGTPAAARVNRRATVDRPTLVASRARGFTRAAPQPARTDRLYVQAGAFSDLANARQLKNELRGLGPTDLAPVTLGGTRYYRVRVGPLESMELADKTLATVINRGHPDARIVVD
jgi:rare lipoprotein A